MESLNRGLVQIYTGGGKGKTTAALGLAMRACGHGLRALMIQFMKGASNTGELASAAKLYPQFEIIPSGKPCSKGVSNDECDYCRECFVNPDNVEDEDRAASRRAIELAKEKIGSGDYQLVILDEIVCALEFGLVELADVIALIEAKPPTLELVLTGRGAPPELIGKADLVTEMLPIKHPWDAGVKARKGIEY